MSSQTHKAKADWLTGKTAPIQLVKIIKKKEFTLQNLWYEAVKKTLESTAHSNLLG